MCLFTAFNRVSAVRGLEVSPTVTVQCRERRTGGRRDDGAQDLVRGDDGDYDMKARTSVSIS